MAEGSRYASYFVRETSSGVTPSNPTLDVFRATKSGLDINITALQSEELRNDAEIADFRLGTRHVEGTATGELSYGTFDLLMAAALRGSWQDDIVVGGVERPSFTFVDYNADINDLPYTVYRGCEVNTLALNVSAAAMTTIEFGLIGRSMEQLAELPDGWTVNTRTATSPMDGFSGSLMANGQPISVITEMAINIDNGIEPRFVVGSKFSIKPSTKRRNVKGTMTAYFEDNSLRLAYLNELEQDIVLQVSDGNAGNTYEITMPRVKITEAPHPVDGEGDIMQNLSYQGLLDAASGNSIKIERKVVVPPPTGVIITPAFTAVMETGETKQFAATVTGTTDQSVTWEVSPTSNGTIDANGLFTASVNATGVTTITATTVADTTIKGTASINSFDTAPIPTLTHYVFSLDSASASKGTLAGTAPVQTLTIADGSAGPVTLQITPAPTGAVVGTPAVKTQPSTSGMSGAITSGKLVITPVAGAVSSDSIVLTDGDGHDTTLILRVTA